MEGSEFAFDCVHLLYHKCHKIHSNCDELYGHFLDWIKKTKNSVNLKI